MDCVLDQPPISPDIRIGRENIQQRSCFRQEGGACRVSLDNPVTEFELVVLLDHKGRDFNSVSYTHLHDPLVTTPPELSKLAAIVPCFTFRALF